jgi:serine/threonine-protein phosphatase PP1 catalytic subunit
MVIPIEAPVNVVGDLHGRFPPLLEFLAHIGHPSDSPYLFLGDYVDRGDNSIETFSMLLALKIGYPKRVWLLRGNHETEDISRLYGFFAECTERYPEGESIWQQFVQVFAYLPIAAIISERIFCVHGGLSPKLTSVDDIRKQTRPAPIEDQGLLCDLLWADPNPDHDDFQDSERGTSYTFGPNVAERFLNENDFDLLCRAHQAVPNGYEFPFTDKRVLTIFSAPDYIEETGNDAAVLQVSKELKCSFVFVKSRVATQSRAVAPAAPKRRPK